VGDNPTNGDVPVCARFVIFVSASEFNFADQSFGITVVLCLGVYIGNSDTSTKYSSASTLLTVTTNISVTSFITFRLLHARRTMAKLLPSADARLYTGVIAILIESAAPVTVFGIIAAILQQLNKALFNKSPGFLVCRYLFDGLYYSFCVSCFAKGVCQVLR
jgi:hypothetical protein